MIAWVLRYAAKVKKNPKASLVYNLDSHWRKEKMADTEEIEYKSYTSSWIVYFFILTGLVLFSFYYPRTTLSIGEHSSLTTIVLPALTILDRPHRLFLITEIISFLYPDHIRFHHIIPHRGSYGYGCICRKSPACSLPWAYSPASRQKKMRIIS